MFEQILLAQWWFLVHQEIFVVCFHCSLGFFINLFSNWFNLIAGHTSVKSFLVNESWFNCRS